MNVWKFLPILFLFLGIAFAVDAPACGNNLSSAGKTYTMNASADINGSTCFTVTAANVTLDCNGFSITGNNTTSTYGIYSNQFNTTIKNCDISNFQDAIRLDTGATSATISNITASTTRSTGHSIYFYNANSNSVIQGSSLSSIGSDNIYIYGGSNINISNNIINVTGAGMGITTHTTAATTLMTMSNNSISASNIGINLVAGANNTVDCLGASIIGTNASSSYGIYSTQFNTTVRNCQISNFSTALNFAGANSSMINNTLSSTFAPSGSNGRAIYATGASLLAFNNTATAPSWVVIFTGASSTIANNTVTAMLSSCINPTSGATDAIVENNTLLGTGGVYLDDSPHRAIIRNNIINTTGTGINVVGGSNVSIDCQGKSIVGTNTSSTYGIYSTQFNTTIRNCNISNFQHGIFLSSATNGLVENTNISTSWAASSSLPRGNGIYVSGGGNHTISNVIANTTGIGQGIFLASTTIGSNMTNIVAFGKGTNGRGLYLSSSGYNTINNATVYSGTSNSLGITGVSSNNNINGITISSVAESAIYIDGGPNTSIDCQGKTIIGTNTSGAYGIYSSQFNTTIRNCNISNFSTAIGFIGATNGLIDNVSLYSTRATDYAANGEGLYLATGANGNTIRNSYIWSAQGYASVMSAADNNVFTNVTTIAATKTGWTPQNADNNTISGSYIEGKGTEGAILLWGSALNNVVENNTINAAGGPTGILMGSSACTGNRFRNNTIANATTLILLNSLISNNTFCLNNFTATSGYYINDTNGSNSYTCNGEGNIYADVMNGSVNVEGFQASSIPGLYKGMSGTGYPYSAVTSAKISGAGVIDSAPLTSYLLSTSNVDYYGIDTKSVSNSTQMASLMSTYGFRLYGQTINYSRFGTDWAALKTAMNYSITNMSSVNFITFYFNSANYSNNTAECATIAANVTDLNSYPYSSGVSFLLIDLNASGEGNKTTFVTNVANCLLNATNNRLRVYSTYTTGVPTTAASPYYLPHISDTGNLSQSIASELGWLRNSTLLTRIYDGSNATFLNFSKEYYSDVIRQLRSTPTGSGHADANIAVMENGDIVIFNTAATAANKTTTYSTSAVGAWDVNTKSLYRPFTASTNVLVPANFATPLLLDNYTKLFMNDNGYTTLFRGYSNLVSGMNYTVGGVGDGSFQVVGNNEARIELWNPDYTQTGQAFVTYEELPYTQVVNFSNYETIVFAGGVNTPEIVNASFDVTSDPTILDKAYGYISVADYNNNNSLGDNETNCSAVNPWETMKIGQALNFTQNYSTNVFIDGFDIGYTCCSACFEQRVKRVVDAVHADGKKAILNTYTIYQTVSHYGDAVMRESCFSRWSGNVSAPTYEYENMTLMVQNAAFETSYGTPVICMAFGDPDDYEKMMWDYHAFAVLYGTSNNNTFRYGQPNFQLQKEIRLPDFDKPMQLYYNNDSPTDWNRRYPNGVVHIDPTRTVPFPNGHYYWFETDEVVNSLSITTFHQMISAPCSSDHNLIYKVNNGTEYTVDECTDIGNVSWTGAYVTKDITADYTTNGHYYIDVYPANRSDAQGMNLWNRVNTTTGVHSSYDTSAVNPPVNWTSYGRVGTSGDIFTTNWNSLIAINKTFSQSVDSSISTVTQSIASTTDGVNNRTTYVLTVSAGSKDYNLTTISKVDVIPNNLLLNATFNGSLLNLSLFPNCSGNDPSFNATILNGESHGLCVQNYTADTGHDQYYVRVSAPHLSDMNYTFLGNESVYCGTLSEANTVYRMIGDVSINGATCFTVAAQNVTLDCNGYSVTGNSTASTYGITTNQFNTTVRNCNISNFANAITLASGAHSFNIDSNNLSTTQSSTVSVLNAANGTASNNRIFAPTGGYAIAIQSTAKNNSFSNNYIEASQYAIWVGGTSNGINLINNTVNASAGVATNGHGIYINGGTNTTVDCQGAPIFGSNQTGTYGVYSNQFNTTVKNCDISNFSIGVFFNDADNGTIENNTIDVTKDYAATNGMCMYVASSSNYNTIRGNTLTKVGQLAMYVQSSTGNNVINNIISSGSNYPIDLRESPYSVLINNTMSSGAVGLLLYDSPNVNISGGSINSSETCINFIGASHNININGVELRSLTGRGVSAVAGSNVSIDCQGKTITGTNTSSTYGVYSDQFNTTIKNCNISNFSNGIYFNGADNGTIDNVSVYTSYTYTAPSNGYGIFLNTNSNYNQISNSNANAPAGKGISFTSCFNNTILNSTGTSSSSQGISLAGAGNNTFINSTGISGTSIGFYLSVVSPYNTLINSTGYSTSDIGIYVSSSSYNTIINSTGSSGANRGYYLRESSNNTFTNCNAIGKSNTFGAVSFYSDSQNNTFANSTINGLGGTRAVTFVNDLNTGNLLINNTIINATNLLYLDANASGNTFCLNNFTDTSGVYVNDTNGSNFYNCTYGGTPATNGTNGTTVYEPTNPGFEAALTNWTASGGIGGITKTAHSGANASMILQTGNAPTVLYQNLTALNLTDGTNYTASAWLYMNSSQEQFVNLTGALSMGSGIGSTANRYKYGLVETAGTADAWTKVNLTFTYNASTDLYFCLYANGSNIGGDGFVYWDDTAIENVTIIPIPAVAATNEGNVYHNVLNGSIVVVGTTNSSAYPGLKIGIGGPGVPYGNTTSGGKFSCNFPNCADYHPLTNVTWAADGENFTIGFVIPKNGTLVYSLNFNKATCNFSVPTIGTTGTPTFNASLAPNGLTYLQIGSGDYYEENVKNYFGVSALPMILNRTYGIDFMTNCTGNWVTNNVTNVTAWNGTDCAGKTAQFTVNTTTLMRKLYSGWNNTVCANSLELTYAGIYGGYTGRINITAT